MTYVRSFKGFSVQNFALGQVFEHQSYKGEIVQAESGKLVCQFVQTGKGDRTTVEWAPGSEKAKENLAVVGLEYDNEEARESGGDIVTRHEVMTDPDLLERFAERGIEVLCIDYQFDEQCREMSSKNVLAQTSEGRYVHLPGNYDPNFKSYWWERLTDGLRADEEVIEIINERYL